MTENNSLLDSATTPAPAAISDTLPEVLNRIASRPARPGPTEEQRQAAEASARRYWCEQNERGLVSRIGARYADCSLSSFNVHGTEDERKRQLDVLRTLEELAGNLFEHAKAGGNVFLYGPPGTGKDHLLVALLRTAITRYAISTEWWNGQDLFGQFRDNIDSQVSERAMLEKFSRPTILAISDPVPPRGDASGYGTTMLYRLLDQRYRNLKGTWVTVNVAKRDEAYERLTGPIFDRLVDGAVRVFCNWPSFRESRRAEWQ